MLAIMYNALHQGQTRFSLEGKADPAVFAKKALAAWCAATPAVSESRTLKKWEKLVIWTGSTRPLPLVGPKGEKAGTMELAFDMRLPPLYAGKNTRCAKCGDQVESLFGEAKEKAFFCSTTCASLWAWMLVGSNNAENHVALHLPQGTLYNGMNTYNEVLARWAVQAAALVLGPQNEDGYTLKTMGAHE